MRATSARFPGSVEEHRMILPFARATCRSIRFQLAPTIVLAVCAVVSTASLADAQAVYGSISGTVKDNTGAVLPGVTVTVTSTERSTTDSVVTNDSGLYTKDRLLPGTYEVRAELQGFKAARV